MINTWCLLELREMLAKNDADKLREFCGVLHPARTAEFLAGMVRSEARAILSGVTLAA